MKIETPATFGAIHAALRAAYDEEIRRLADTYRSRILAGEFSGTDDEGRGDPAYMRLENELEKSHPWTQDERLARAVLAVSPWAYRDNTPMSDLGVEFESDRIGNQAAECIANDVLSLGVSRGWVKGYKPLGPSYVLKVA